MTRNQWERLSEETRQALAIRVQRRSGHPRLSAVNLIIQDFLEVCEEYTADRRKAKEQT